MSVPRRIALTAGLALAAAGGAHAQTPPPPAPPAPAAKVDVATTSRKVALRQRELTLRATTDRPVRLQLKVVLRIKGRTALGQQVRLDVPPGAPVTRAVPLSSRVRKKIRASKKAPRIRVTGTARDAAGGQLKISVSGKLG